MCIQLTHVQPAHLLTRMRTVVLANIIAGFSTAWLLRLSLGADPCSTMNAGIAAHLPISFGTWSLIMNLLLMVIVFRTDRRQLGFGTLSNMVLVGYSADFFGWLIDRNVPAAVFDSWETRLAIGVPVLAVFILAAGVYIAMDLGTSPYDAIPAIIAKRHSSISYRTVRTLWDVTALAVGVLAGASFGPVSVVCAFALGPVIAWVGRVVRERLYQTGGRRGGRAPAPAHA
ncbi:MAG: hypothetical protein LIO45_02470 [Clostridiales bacterium]|nr:hypothetical protein [Clostridiales bacterium]